MIIKSVNLETVVGITSTLPENDHPEFAFAGKSNVGKSSLINAVMNRKAYARVSGEPGKTQTINYYNINDALYLVDLPGYGYAKVSQSTKEKWGKMIERYLKRSKQLKNVFLLVDITGMIFSSDAYALAEGVDEIPEEVLNARSGVVHVYLLFYDNEGRLIAFSAETKQGLEDIYAILEADL